MGYRKEGSGGGGWEDAENGDVGLGETAVSSGAVRYPQRSASALRIVAF